MARASYSTTPLLRSLVHRPQGVILVYMFGLPQASIVVQLLFGIPRAIPSAIPRDSLSIPRDASGLRKIFMDSVPQTSGNLETII